jgi:hypothetical protein
MKRIHIPLFIAAFAILLAAGCATPERPTGRFLQRENPVVAIVPSANNSPEVSAPIILDKCWEQSLTKWGFTVKNADNVVTYASSTGVQIADLKDMPTAKLGADLGADYLLFDEVMDWGSSYHVISSKTVVACRSVLVEASTGAVVWKYDWIYIDASDSSGDPIAALVGAAVHSLVNSMTDAESRAAEVGVTVTTNTMPYPGFAPAPKPGSKK